MIIVYQEETLIHSEMCFQGFILTYDSEIKLYSEFEVKTKFQKKKHTVPELAAACKFIWEKTIKSVKQLSWINKFKLTFNNLPTYHILPLSQENKLHPIFNKLCDISWLYQNNCITVPVSICPVRQKSLTSSGPFFTFVSQSTSFTAFLGF